MKANLEDLDKIRKISHKEYPRGTEFYIFECKVCNNDIDADLDKISTEALYELKDAILGRSVKNDFNVDMQVYDSYVERCENEYTADYTALFQLIAKIYVVADDNVADDNLKELLDIVNNKETAEVTLGASFVTYECSICGKDVISNNCGHIKGNVYSDKLAHRIYKGLGEVYELRFRSKAKGKSDERADQTLDQPNSTMLDETDYDGAAILDILRNFKDDNIVLSKFHIESLLSYVDKLKDDRSKIIEHAQVELHQTISNLLPDLDGNILNSILSALTLKEILALKSAINTSTTNSNKKV